MRLSKLLLGASLIFSSVLARIQEKPCTPHEDHMTCLLYWITNTGMVRDMADPKDFIAWAHAYIYAPGCTLWGGTKNGLDSDVKVFAWGLDHSDPLVLNPERVEGLGYDTPKFKYRGQVWGYEDCVCRMGDFIQRTHICKCPFKCEPVPVIG